MKFITPATNTGTATITSANSNVVRCAITYTVFDVDNNDIKMKSEII